MAAVLIAVLIVAVLAGGVLLWTRGRRRPDGVDSSFRRQIDALSPDSRRPTIDRMKPSEPPSDDEDGTHGT